MWLDDHGWWVLQVVFRSSGWRKFIGLEAAVDFLWDDRDFLAYSWWRRNPDGGSPDVRLRDAAGSEYGLEVDDYADESLLRADLRHLADRAVQEVDAYRARFRTLDDWVRVLTKRKETRHVNFYSDGIFRHTAIVCGLAGHRKLAERYFDREHEILTRAPEPAGTYYYSQGELQLVDVSIVRPDDDDRLRADRNRELKSRLAHPDQFRDEIEQAVRRFRSRVRLPDTPIAFE